MLILNYIDTFFAYINSLLPHSQFLDSYVWSTLTLIIKALLWIVILLVTVAYLTLWERKVLGAIQIRKGPNVNGPFGVLQPLLDGGKLFFKETIIPSNADKLLFCLAPVITFGIAISQWSVMPLDVNRAFMNINVGILYLLALSSFGVYGIILSGWASNSQYAFLGAMRSASQMIAYEVCIGLIIVCVILFSGSMNLSDIVVAQSKNWYDWNIIKLFPIAIMFYIVMLAETNRHPFDLPESEAELVSGYNVEYSGFMFGMFFLGEYANMIFMSALFSVLFLGGWQPLFNITALEIIPGFIWFALKVFILITLMIQIRTTIPRYRYDQIMKLCWKVFVPISLVAIVVCSAYLVYFGKYSSKPTENLTYNNTTTLSVESTGAKK